MSATTEFPKFNRHPVTSSLIAVLVEVAVGDTITYEGVSKAVGSPRAIWSKYIAAVRHIMTRDHGIVFETLRGVGYRRLQNNEVAGHTGKYSARIRRTARRAAKELAYGVKYEDLSPKEQSDYNLKVAQFGILHHASTAKAERSLRAAVEIRNGHLNIGDTLKVLSE